ncbi:hypothetical protein [Ramlibacter aurantiacus]|uniref:hypothetical protein n=1 Tax=Ramlibacter aurantiacus TaxID=2801330 RepID=UPI001F2482BD|nr:hypothetical protein [Ramlibacter aurantiacus]
MNIKNAWTLAAACTLLVACGGGGGGGDGIDTGAGGTTQTVPQSALGSVGALVTYLKELIGTASDTVEPLSLGNITLPVADTAEPTAL